MAVTNGLRRLLRIRDLEEEQSQIALGSALGELKALKNAQAAAVGRGRQGREVVADSIRSGSTENRHAGLIEGETAERHALMLQPRIAASEENASRLREELLVKRVECRQAETLIGDSEARVAAEAARRDQRGLDDWFSSRKFRDQAAE